MDPSPQHDLGHDDKTRMPTLHGSCLCGTSTYTVTGPPIQAIIWHCNNCKKWGGGAFAANVWIPSKYFQLDEASSSHVKRYADSETDAGRTMDRVSCIDCGSSLYVDIPYFDVVSVTRGTIDGFEDLKGLDPVVEFYCCRQLAWVKVTAQTDRKETLE